MRLLLDTHCWLWCLNEPQKLTSSMQQAIANPENELFLSVANIWEIAIKVAIGELTIPQPLSKLIAEQLPIDGINTLDIKIIHALKIEELPLYHQDPFDRQFRKDLRWWFRTDKKISDRILNLVEATILNPTEGIGKPEHLKFFPGSKWSRRITQEHRLVYQISSDKIIFLQCWYHYK